MHQDMAMWSGASPQEVAADLQPLVDFREKGISLAALQAQIQKRLLPHLMRYDLPTFQSMFNAFPEEGAAFGARIALAYNQGVTNWQVSPGGAVLEELCCRALCRLFGLAPTADATFMYCGTYANQQALYLALHRMAERAGFDLAEKGVSGFDDPSSLVVLTSTDAHFSLKHAVRTLGLGDQSLIPLAVDGQRRVDLKRMEQALDALRPDKRVLCVVATAGTTSTGAVDPLLPMARICQETGAWLHVDGAYGLAYSLVPEWESLFAGVELADSVSWDPHKQLGIPIPNSLLFVRQGTDLLRMALHSAYFNREEDVEPNPGLKSAPSTRPFSALPLVASLRHQGLKGVRQRLRAPLTAIRTAAAYVAQQDDLELLHDPDTGILCFRATPAGRPEDALDALQAHIYQQILAGGERSISMTRLDDRAVLRLVAISPVVTGEALVETIDAVRSLARAYCSER